MRLSKKSGKQRKTKMIIFNVIENGNKFRTKKTQEHQTTFAMAVE